MPGVPQRGFLAAGPRPSHKPKRKEAITARSHHGQVRRRFLRVSAVSATGPVLATGDGATGADPSRTVPHAVQKRVAAGKAEPQFVQNEVTVMVDTLTALPQEPTIALDPAIISSRASLLAGSA